MSVAALVFQNKNANNRKQAEEKINTKVDEEGLDDLLSEEEQQSMIKA